MSDTTKGHYQAYCDPGDEGDDDEARVQGELADMVIDDLREIAGELARELQMFRRHVGGRAEHTDDLLARAREKGLLTL